MAGKRKSLLDVMPKIARKVLAEAPPAGILDDISVRGIAAPPDPKTRPAAGSQ